MVTNTAFRISGPKSFLLAQPQGSYGLNTEISRFYPGFDRCTLLTTSEMATWWNYSYNFDVGVYLGGASTTCGAATTGTWLAQVMNMGWGVMPIWVGPQAPCNPQFSHRINIDPSLAYNEGVAEADSSVNAAESKGMPASIIYYDIEDFNSNRTQACADSVISFLTAC